MSRTGFVWLLARESPDSDKIEEAIVAMAECGDQIKNCMPDMRGCMDWRSVKFDWNHARAFLVTAEEGSLTAAATALGMTQPTLGRQVSALEDELGAVLFDRAGGRLVLTAAGEALLDHVREMGESAMHVSRLAHGQSTELRGSVTISASEIYAAHLLPEVLQRLREQVPDVDITVVADNTASDLNRREADIAIRNFQPVEPELIARKIRDDTAWLYATPGYLQSIGNPTTADDYSQADFISFTTTQVLVEWFNQAWP